MSLTPSRYFKLNLFLKTIIVVVLVVSSNSCRKEINVQLPEYTQKLVVEASIETGQPSQVLLSFTAPYFGNADLSNPSQFFVKGAFVTVSDGSLIDTLKELEIGGFPVYIGTKIFGQIGKNYQLTMLINNKTYTASTSILQPIALDSLFFKWEKDTLGFCWAHLSEPAGLGNCYRWFAKRITKDQFFVAPFSSAFDDKFVDGKSFDFAYERPSQPNAQQANDDDPEKNYYRVGDTIIVKFCTIGYNEYNFWRSYYANKSSNGNPFSAPANLQSTINGGDAIGAFVGYGTSFDTLVVKPKP
jgi:hypothetical protein